MGKIFKYVAVFMGVLLVSAGFSSAASQPPAVGGVLPEFSLSVPQNDNNQKYLGVVGKEAFSIPEIKADVVIIEIFSMYCPFCQREAPSINEMYRKIESDQRLKGKVKLVGIGAGNSTFEVGFFKKTYNVPFPLFPDGNFSIYNKIGEVGTPYFICIRIKNDGSHRVFYSRVGGAKDADQLMKKLLRNSGLR
jgi:thiol-disulfide isomerase/thioredoxin